jgi:hypothetical protein
VSVGAAPWRWAAGDANASRPPRALRAGALSAYNPVTMRRRARSEHPKEGPIHVPAGVRSHVLGQLLLLPLRGDV